jgi:hypothetical protein
MNVGAARPLLSEEKRMDKAPSQQDDSGVKKHRTTPPPKVPRGF